MWKVTAILGRLEAKKRKRNPKIFLYLNQGRQEATPPENLKDQETRGIFQCVLSYIPIDRLTSRHDSFSPSWGASTPLRTHCH